MRWRTKKEVISGKGETICANKKCDQKKNLCNYEVNFQYFEENEQKNTLVKACVCEECALKLNYNWTHKKLEPNATEDRKEEVRSDLNEIEEKLKKKLKKLVKTAI